MPEKNNESTSEKISLEQHKERILAGKSERQRRWISLGLGAVIVGVGLIDAITGLAGYIAAEEAIGLGIPLVLYGAGASKKDVKDVTKEALKDE